MRFYESAPFRPRLLLSAARCAPGCACASQGEHGACEYRVAWSINPHMRIGATDGARALWQHGRLLGVLAALGADVETIPFVHGAYDSVFAKDSALLLRRRGTARALLANPRHDERKKEQSARAGALEARGFRVERVASDFFEGGDVVMRPGASAAFLGHGFRSSPRVCGALESFLGAPVTPLELREPNLYHLDMALAILPDETVLVCPDALTPSSMRALEREARGDVVRISRAHALSFALNFVVVGRTLVLDAGAQGLDDALHARGWATRPVDLSEFLNAGGSAACLVARVHDPEEVATSTTAAIRSTAA